MDKFIGNKINGFELIEELGKGAYGTVFKVNHNNQMYDLNEFFLISKTLM